MAVVDNSDVNHGHFELVECIAFCVIIPVFVALRFLSRILVKQLGSDDWTALAAAIFALSCNVQTIVAINHGWGRHMKHLTPSQVEICLLLHWSFQLTYKITVALNKMSILFLYLRIMPNRIYRLLIHLIFIFVTLFAISTTIAGVFQCVPIDKAWHKAYKGHCYNLVAAWYTNAVFSIVTDFIILCVPMHMVYNLQRDKREKILLYFVFGMGGFVTFTSIMRFFALKDANSADSTYDVKSGFWSIIEINIGVIVICLPPLRALLSRQFKFLKESRSRLEDREHPYPLSPLDSSFSKKSNPTSSSATTSKSRQAVVSGEWYGAAQGGKGRGQTRMYPEDSEEELVFGSDGAVVSESLERSRSRSRSRSIGSVGLRMERTLSGSMGGGGGGGGGGGAGLEKTEMERGNDMRILKTTQIIITERLTRGDVEVENEPEEVRAWDRQLRGD